MVVMFGAMAVLRRIDQEEPLVLLYARVGYLTYVVLTALVYVLLHFRIISRRDLTLVSIPRSSGAPSLRDAFQQARVAAEKSEEERVRKERDDAPPENDDQSTVSTTSAPATSAPNGTVDAEGNGADGDADADAEKEEMEIITVMEYDLRHLASARRSWVTSSCFLAAVHYHMQSVSPLIMSGVMGIIRLLSEDPLVQIHLRGIPAIEKLARPFTAEKNPLASLIKEMTPSPDAQTAGGTAQTTSTGQEDLHDDGDDDDDDDDSAPAAAASISDENIKSDFEDEDKTDCKKKQ